MVRKAKQICENSLQWILAVRTRKHIHKYDMQNMKPEKFPEIFGDYSRDFGHSGGSLSWSIYHAKKIDEIGLKKWLKTDDAQGYDVYFRKMLGLK